MAFIPTFFAVSFGVDTLINTQQKTAYFIEFLDKGMWPIAHHSDQNVSKFAELFAELSEEILTHLMEKGCELQTGIVINKDEGIFTLQEENHNVLVSVEIGDYKVTRTLRNTLFVDLQKKLVNEVIFYSSRYQKATLNTVLNYIMFDAIDDLTSTMNAVEYIVSSTDEETTLQTYSDQLDKALRAVPVAHPIGINGLISHFKTNYALWNLGRFGEVISRSDGVAQFILQKANDPAIILWNSHHELTDSMGRRAPWQEKIT